MKKFEAMKFALSNNKKRIYKTLFGAASIATIGLGAKVLLDKEEGVYDEDFDEEMDYEEEYSEDEEPEEEEVED